MQVTSLIILAITSAVVASPIDLDGYLDVEIDKNSAIFNGTFSENSIQKRATFGWVAAYADSDTSCKGDYAEPRPEIRTDCVPISPAGSNLGVRLPSFHARSYRRNTANERYDR